MIEKNDELDCMVSGFNHVPAGVTITLKHRSGELAQATGENYRIAYMKAWDLLKEKVRDER